jgi:hypothetical protein
MRMEDRNKGGMSDRWGTPTKYQVSVFRPEYLEWLSKNLKGKYKVSKARRRYGARTYTDDYFFASFSRRDDSILFMMKYSDLLLIKADMEKPYSKAP